MNYKRFASAALASVMALSMAAPAFAAGDTTVITGTYTPITLDVTVPGTGKAVINPYALPIEIGEDADKKAINVVGEQITTSVPLLIENRSDVGLKVNVKDAAGAVKGNLKLVDATPADSKTEAQIFLQMFPAAGIEEDYTDADVAAAFSTLSKDTEGYKSAKDVKILPVKADKTGESMDEVIELAAGEDGELVDGGAAFFRLSGKVGKKADWATTDSFTVKVVFSFEPVLGESGDSEAAAPVVMTGALVLDDTTLDDFSTSSTTATLTPDLPDDVTVSSWSWSSSDEEVATVSGSGTTATVSYEADGSATITVEGTGSDNIVYKATADVTCAA